MTQTCTVFSVFSFYYEQFHLRANCLIKFQSIAFSDKFNNLVYQCKYFFLYHSAAQTKSNFSHVVIIPSMCKELASAKACTASLQWWQVTGNFSMIDMSTAILHYKTRIISTHLYPLKTKSIKKNIKNKVFDITNLSVLQGFEVQFAMLLPRM